MKISSLTFIFCLFCSQLFAKVESSDRLINLNKYWSAVDMTAYQCLELDDYSEKDLIQFHLLEVIDSLNKVELDHYDQAQRYHRVQLLESLQGYANRRLFPLNTYHYSRTPYFIDDNGTACAVGYMIIESGNKTMAEKISNEMNFAYLEDMPYLEINQWAQAHGFTVDELKWIQPAYQPNCLPGQVIQPQCPPPSQFSVGCFNPDWQAAGLVQPITYLTEINTGAGWSVDTNNMWMIIGAAPGQYRITLTDSTNSSVVYNYNIVAPPAILSNDSVAQHASSSSTCDGKLIVRPSRGTAPYQISVFNTQLPSGGTNNTGVFDSLCPGVYTIVLSDATGCQSTDSALIQFATGLDQYTLSDGFHFQNPLQEKQLSLNTDMFGLKVLSIYNLKGKLVHQEQFSENQLYSNLDLREGLYIIEISNEVQQYRKKLIVHN